MGSNPNCSELRSFYQIGGGKLSPWAKALCLFSVNEVLLEHNHIHLLHIACGFQGTTAELSSHVLLNIGDTLWRNVAFDDLSSYRRSVFFRKPGRCSPPHTKAGQCSLAPRLHTCAACWRL